MGSPDRLRESLPARSRRRLLESLAHCHRVDERRRRADLGVAGSGYPVCERGRSGAAHLRYPLDVSPRPAACGGETANGLAIAYDHRLAFLANGEAGLGVAGVGDPLSPQSPGGTSHIFEITGKSFVLLACTKRQIDLILCW